MTVADALKILELQSPYSKEELGKAYRHALMVWHPDRFSGNEELIKKAEAKTREIIEAFELLSSLSASQGAAGTAEQAEKAAPVRKAGTQDSQRAAGTAPMPQVERLTTTGKKGRGSSDRATWIITGVSVVVAGVLIAMLSKHTPKKEEAAQATASSAATEAATKGTPPVHAQVEDTTKTKAETSVASNRERAERGDAEAQDNLGWSFYAGEGVSKDEDEAVKWFRKAAEQGNVRAQWHLGHVYRFGTGAGIKDVNEGLKWWHKAAEGGEARAQWVLGAIYSTHEKEEDAYRTGLIKDDREAVKWLRKSAEQGNANGEIYLAGMFERGEGVPKDEEEAANWYRKAADQNIPEAQYDLGLLYAEGKVGRMSAEVWRKNTKTTYEIKTAANYVEAHVWLNLAGANGYKDARTKIADIEYGMTRTEIDQAASRAKEIFEKLKAKEKK